MTAETHTHVFTIHGMGPAPFAFVGMAEIPSKSLAEANPSAYNNALAALPRLKAGCGTCANCGMAIMHICIVKNADGDLYGVGCDCVEKTGDVGLVAKVTLARRKAARLKREAKADAKRKAFLESPEYAARQAAWKAEKDAREAAKAKRCMEAEAKLTEAGANVRYLWEHAAANEFANSLMQQLMEEGSLSERQTACLCKLAFGRMTTANAPKYDALTAAISRGH